jgi:hypothetical protein
MGLAQSPEALATLDLADSAWLMCRFARLWNRGAARLRQFIQLKPTSNARWSLGEEAYRSACLTEAFAARTDRF